MSLRINKQSLRLEGDSQPRQSKGFNVLRLNKGDPTIGKFDSSYSFVYLRVLKMGNPLYRYYKKIFKDVEPAKDLLSEMTEDEPKSIEEMKRKLSKKMENKKEEG